MKASNKLKFQLKISKMIAATTMNTGTCGVNATLGPFHKGDKNIHTIKESS